MNSPRAMTGRAGISAAAVLCALSLMAMVIVFDGRAAGGASGVDARLDLNTADAAALMLLPGIGEKRAAAIVEYRERIGGFRSTRQLMRISGIGPRTLRGIEPLVEVSKVE